jgi:hypothetical protein
MPAENLIDVADRCCDPCLPTKLIVGIISVHIGDWKRHSALRI